MNRQEIAVVSTQSPRRLVAQLAAAAPQDKKADLENPGFLRVTADPSCNNRRSRADGR